MRLKDKIALVFGAGQSPGPTPAIGNGRAASILYAREGAQVMAVDRNLESAQETERINEEAGGQAATVEADETDEAAVKAAGDQT